ncbi:uncharacterized protein MEPE_06623 [Melanopsichium pennsylvanicum]|uniref:Uncharacterized protein n=1 Tax=Melanopsichium pennsylvanicum TaxID=63383 RepID=A0AAJ4XTS5_9BASI|nr:uncharacterized protein MEPE_06623 [Melanopsichium pennsylvanicum]
MKFALKHKNWTVEDWKWVIWSDETKINFTGPDGGKQCWVKDAGFSSKLVKPTVKFGGGCIMIWGCMTWEGIGTMCMVIGRMDSSQYIEMLDEKLTKTMLEMCNGYSLTNLIL